MYSITIKQLDLLVIRQLYCVGYHVLIVVVIIILIGLLILSVLYIGVIRTAESAKSKSALVLLWCTCGIQEVVYACMCAYHISSKSHYGKFLFQQGREGEALRHPTLPKVHAIMLYATKGLRLLKD